MFQQGAHRNLLFSIALNNARPLKWAFGPAAGLWLALSGHAQNLVVNGSFETAAPGWTFTGGLSILGPPSLPAFGVDGTHYVGLGGADIPNSTLSQTISVVAGSNYWVTLATAAGGSGAGRVGSVRVDIIAPDNSVLASRSVVNVSPALLTGTNGFTRANLSFTTPNNVASVTLRITDTSPDGGVAVDPCIDDVRIYPRPPSNPENLMINGGFEMPELLAGAIHLPPQTMPGWHTTDDSFEVWSDGSGAVEGVQHLEILSHAATATVWQTVTTIPGEAYALSFFHSPRPGVDSTLTVAIDSRVVATLSEDGSTLTAFRWQRFRTNFTATGAATTIAFSDNSVAASGTHIDNVALVRLPLASMLRVSEVELCWESVASRRYQVQYRSALTANLWLDLGSPIQGNGTTNCIRDAVPAGEPQRFYRVAALP